MGPRGAGRTGLRGAGRTRPHLVVRAQECVLSLSAQIGIFESAFFPSPSLTVLSFFPKLVSNLEKLLFLSFFNYLCLLALVFCPIWQQISKLLYDKFTPA